MKAAQLLLCLCAAVCSYSAVVHCQEESDREIGEDYIDKFRAAFKMANVSETEVLTDTSQTSIGASFNCPTTKPSSFKAATSVHALTPWDVDILAGMGDSVTAGMGAGASTILTDFIEYRGLSWSIGGNKNLDKVITLPNVLRKYNPEVTGFAEGTSWLSTKELSVAKSGAVAKKMLGQAEDLVKKMDKMYSSRDEVDLKWKVITLWIGGNDLCAICGGNAEEHATLYAERIKHALDYLRSNVKRAYINLVLIIDVTELAKIQSLLCDTVHLVACTCVNLKREVISEASRLYNEKLQDLMLKEKYYNRDGDDFTVVLQPFFSDTKLPLINGKPDKSFFAPDCFHFSQKGHGVGAVYLWNNMLEPLGAKTDTIDWEDVQDFICPSPEAPYFYTSRNSGSNVLNANSPSDGNHGSNNLVPILVGTGVGIVVIALAVIIVVVGVVRWRKKSSSEITLEKLQLLATKL